MQVIKERRFQDVQSGATSRSSVQMFSGTQASRLCGSEETLSPIKSRTGEEMEIADVSEGCRRRKLSLPERVTAQGKGLTAQ